MRASGDDVDGEAGSPPFAIRDTVMIRVAQSRERDREYVANFARVCGELIGWRQKADVWSE